VAIGIHNAQVISSSMSYYGVTDGNFSFIPLGSSQKQTIKEILNATEQGRSYGKLLSSVYPMIEDSNGNVLSMPPVINGDLTRLRPGISKLFIDVTGTDERVVDASTAIIASMLSDIKARVFKVQVGRDNENPNWTPDMTPSEMNFDLKLTNDILGFDFDHVQARAALEKSRLGLDSSESAIIPRFRNDIIHPIDLAEEVALGHGIARISPQAVSSSLAGSLKPRLQNIDAMIEILIGLGLTEVWNFSLTSKEVVIHCFDTELLKVEDSKSESFEYLRCDIIASLLRVLGSSTHQEYPQSIFEEAPTFKRDKHTRIGVSEEEHVAVAMADSEANYTMIRSKLDAFLRSVVGDSNFSFKTATDAGEIFAAGRTAEVYLKTNGKDTRLGIVGEVSPATLERFGLEVPVAGFELNLEPFLKH
ncbi:MAG: hypothetical protein OK439_06440, partial [Thaumarchaeota archaeon]|nr:hypothetical protein [Nitrososphaerota archaeon]